MRALKITYIAAMIVAWWIGGTGAVLATFFMGTPVGLLLAFIIDQQQQLRQAGRRINHLFVIAIPEGRRTFSLGQFENDYIAVPVGQVNRNVDKQKAVLIRAKNQTGAEVIPIYWRDGQHVAETIAEYRLRCITTMTATMQERHTKLQQTDQDWYLQYHHQESNQTEWTRNLEL